MDESGRVVNPSDTQGDDTLSHGKEQHNAGSQQPSVSLGGAAKEDDDFVYVKVPRLPTQSARVAANALPAYMVRLETGFVLNCRSPSITLSLVRFKLASTCVLRSPSPRRPALATQPARGPSRGVAPMPPPPRPRSSRQRRALPSSPTSFNLASFQPRWKTGS